MCDFKPTKQHNSQTFSHHSRTILINLCSRINVFTQNTVLTKLNVSFPNLISSILMCTSGTDFMYKLTKSQVKTPVSKKQILLSKVCHPSPYHNSNIPLAHDKKRLNYNKTILPLWKAFLRNFRWLNLKEPHTCSFKCVT